LAAAAMVAVATVAAAWVRVVLAGADFLATDTLVAGDSAPDCLAVAVLVDARLADASSGIVLRAIATVKA
jgi:hypothetical protein